MDLKRLENRYEDTDYKIKIISPEFTCLCPGKPDQPDFATISIIYVPDKYLIELKSLKYYFLEYRDKEIYHENAINKIKQDLVKKIKPRYMRVRGDWNVRGGITTIVECEYIKEDWEGIPEGVEIKSTEHTSMNQ